MTSPAPLPEPLEFSPLAQGLLYSLDAKGPREILLARQATWAAAHLLNMMGDAPAQPDAAWLRLFTTADRIYHRNLRQLDRIQAHRPAAPAPAPAPTAAEPATPPPPSRRNPLAPHRRPDPSHPPRPNLDRILQSQAPGTRQLAITPTPAAPCSHRDPSAIGASPPAPR